MCGKGMEPAKFRNVKAYRENEDYWDFVERKKKMECWKCDKGSLKCKNAYQNDTCLGYDPV